MASTVATLYTDGACEPNPGPCGCGAVLLDESDAIIWTLSEYLGEGTNNIGEMTAILRGIKRAKELGIKTLKVFTDSELCVHLYNGTKQTKKAHLQDISTKTTKASKDMVVTVEWVKGHADNKWNNMADELAGNAVKSILSKDVTKDNETSKDKQRPKTATGGYASGSSASKPEYKPRPDDGSPKLWLKCPFNEKDKVKQLGARWSPDEKKWYAPDTPDAREKFKQWIQA